MVGAAVLGGAWASGATPDWRDAAGAAPLLGAAQEAVQACAPVGAWALRAALVQDLGLHCGPAWLAAQTGQPDADERAWWRSRVLRADLPLVARLRAGLVLARAGGELPLELTELLRVASEGDLPDAVLVELPRDAALDPLLNDRAAVVRWARDGETPTDEAGLLRRAAWGWTAQSPRVVRLASERLAEQGRGEAVAGGPRHGRWASVHGGDRRRELAWRAACARHDAACAFALADWFASQAELPDAGGWVEGDGADGGTWHDAEFGLAVEAGALATAWIGARWGAGHPQGEAAADWLGQWGAWWSGLPAEERERGLRSALGGDGARTEPLEVLRERGGTAAGVALAARLICEAAGEQARVERAGVGLRLVGADVIVLRAPEPGQSWVARTDRELLSEALREVAAADGDARLDRLAAAWAGSAAEAPTTPAERLGALLRPAEGL